MANPQAENGHTRIANEILEEVYCRKFNGTQFRILLVVWRYTYGFSRKQHELSINFLVNATGITKRQIQKELNNLIDLKVIIEERAATFNLTRIVAFNKNYDEWVIPSTLENTEVNNKEGGVLKDTSTGVLKDTSTGVLKDTQERKVKAILNKEEKEGVMGTKEIMTFWDMNGFGINNINAKQKLLMYLDEGITGDVIFRAMEIASEKNVTNYKYLETVLNDWINRNVKTLADVQALELAYEQKKLVRTGKTKVSKEDFNLDD